MKNILKEINFAITKQKIAKEIHKQTGLSERISLDYVKEFFREVSAYILENNQLTIRGLGKFRLLDKKSRPARNPITKEVVLLEQRKVLSYLPSRKLKEALNNKNSYKNK